MCAKGFSYQGQKERVEVSKGTAGSFIPPFSAIVKQSKRLYLQEALEGQGTSTAIPYLEDEGGEKGKSSHEGVTW